jgi:hypothetical protein
MSQAIVPVIATAVDLSKVYLSEPEYTNDFGRGGIRVMYEYPGDIRDELLVRTDDMEFRFGLGSFEKKQKKGTFDYSLSASTKKDGPLHKALARLDARIVDLVVEMWPKWFNGAKMTADALVMTNTYGGFVKTTRSKTTDEEYDPAVRLMFRETLDRETKTRDFNTKVHHGTRHRVPIDRNNLLDAVAAETSGPVVFSLGLFISKTNVYCSAGARMVNVKRAGTHSARSAQAAVVLCDDSFFADDETPTTVTAPTSRKRNGESTDGNATKRVAA